MTTKTTQKTPLEEIFTDKEELQAAQLILQATPKQMGQNPSNNSTQRAIIFQAYKNQTRQPNFSCNFDYFISEREKYCQEQEIFEKLEQERYLKCEGRCGKTALYVLPRE